MKQLSNGQLTVLRYFAQFKGSHRLPKPEELPKEQRRGFRNSTMRLLCEAGYLSNSYGYFRLTKAGRDVLLWQEFLEWKRAQGHEEPSTT